jgi:D-glycero-alpha-D-manno-heptose 1-phosphate guanylyltransferase
MEAIILAGGFGTRLRSVVPDLPKPMAPVAGRPFLEILLTNLSQQGFGRIVLSLGYMADKVISHFGASFAGMELVYEVEVTPLGTGGAVKQALDRCSEDHAFVFNGDTYLEVQAKEIETQWLMHRVPIIVARPVDDTARYGRLDVENGRVRGFSEKKDPGPGLINAGCYVLPVDILKGFSHQVPFSLESEFLAKKVETDRVDAFVASGQFIDIGVPEDFNRAQTELAGVCI